VRNKFSIHIFALIMFLVFSSCDTYFVATQNPSSQGATPDITGTPSSFSQGIYETSDLGELCFQADCQPDYDELSAEFREDYAPEMAGNCSFDDDPNRTSQFLLHHQAQGINGLDLLLSKEDLFFMAWVSLRYQINPHFLLGVISQESYGDCAAVSYAGAEGCFQITNDYGRAQLEDSYPDRVESWYWNEGATDYYPDNIFINPIIWFGAEPQTDQYRMTLDPASSTVLGMSVSSVVNFNFGAIASALYYRWEDYFLYYHYESLQDTVENLIETTAEGKASLMASIYNGGIGRFTSALKAHGANYLKGMSVQTQDYVERVTDYCRAYQQGDQLYTTTYAIEEVEYLVDLLAMTYSDAGDVDWDGLKQDIRTNFFSSQEEITLVDDVKALIYYISTYDTSLAPEWPIM